MDVVRSCECVDAQRTQVLLPGVCDGHQAASGSDMSNVSAEDRSLHLELLLKIGWQAAACDKEQKIASMTSLSWEDVAAIL